MSIITVPFVFMVENILFKPIFHQKTRRISNRENACFFFVSYLPVITSFPLIFLTSFLAITNVFIPIKFTY